MPSSGLAARDESQVAPASDEVASSPFEEDFILSDTSLSDSLDQDEPTSSPENDPALYDASDEESVSSLHTSNSTLTDLQRAGQRREPAYGRGIRRRYGCSRRDQPSE